MTEKHKNSIIALTLIFLVLITVGFYTYGIIQKNRTDERTSEATRTLAATSETPYTDMQGKPFSFDQYKGKVRIVNSWASWSPFGVDELKNLQVLAKEYKESGVVVIAINRKEPLEQAKAFLRTLGNLEDITFIIDVTDAYYGSVGGFSMPETVFYDTKGHILYHKRGALTLQEMQDHTKEILQTTASN